MKRSMGMPVLAEVYLMKDRIRNTSSDETAFQIILLEYSDHIVKQKLSISDDQVQEMQQRDMSL